MGLSWLGWWFAVGTARSWPDHAGKRVDSSYVFTLAYTRALGWPFRHLEELRRVTWPTLESNLAQSSGPFRRAGRQSALLACLKRGKYYALCIMHYETFLKPQLECVDSSGWLLVYVYTRASGLQGACWWAGTGVGTAA